MSRRRFIKRTGGATVASVVGWSLTGAQVRAEGDGGSGSFGMLCISPELTNTPVYAAIGPVNIPQSGGGAVAMTINVEANTGKTEDLAGVDPYNYIAFSGTGSVNVYTGGALATFASYFADYTLVCSGDGVISGSASNRPWETKTLTLFVGTTPVEVKVTTVSPIFTGGGSPGAILTVATGLKIQFAYIDPNTSNAYISSLNPDTFKVNNLFLPVEKSS